MRDCSTVEELWEAIRTSARSRSARPSASPRPSAWFWACRRHATATSLAAELARRGRLSAHQPADRRQPLLGARVAWNSVLCRRSPNICRSRTALDQSACRSTALADEDRRRCRAIGRHGAALIREGDGVLTHCNAGGLATADYGTALALLFAAAEAGKQLHGLRRRNPTAVAGRPADGLGAAAARHRRRR